MTATTIKRFVAFDGVTHYSIRQRPDGNFQIFHDGAKLEDGSQPYWMEDQPMSGLFGSVEAAEAEMLSLPMAFQAVISN